MSLLGKIRDVLGGSEPTSFRYQCVQCENEFTSTKADMGEVSCPGCGRGGVHQVTVHA